MATYSANGVTFNNTGYLAGSDAGFPTGSNARSVIVCASSPFTNADDVFFSYGTGANNQSFGISVFSTFGKMVNDKVSIKQLSKNQLQIDMSLLPQGIYLVKTKGASSLVHKQ